MITKEKNLFIILISTFLVFYCHALNVNGFFHDGYLYAAFGKSFPWDSWLIPSQSSSQFKEFLHHPPFFFILEGLFFKIVGAGFWQARLFGLLWVLSSFSLIFYYIKSRFNIRLAFFSSLLLLLIPSLMKKSRFPNMDQALLFSYSLTLVIYFEAWTKKSSKLWALSGMAWGLCMLLKGVSGVLLLPLIFAHQVYSNKSLKFLLKKDIWLAFLAGIGLFSLWPMALWSIGRLDIFYEYLDFQLFSTAIKGRGHNEIHFFQYFLQLLKNAPHVSILFIWSLVLFKRGKIKKYNEFYIFNLICFLSYIIPLSFMKFKYSHYLIPIYPSFSIIAAYPLMIKLENKMQVFKKVWCSILTLAFIPLFIFGVTNKVRRDKEIFMVSKEFSRLTSVPKEWLVVDESYSYWALSGLSSFVFSANPHRLTTSSATKFIKHDNRDTLIFTTNSVTSEFKKLLEDNYRILKRLDSKNMTVWATKEQFK
jgi:4-amino-4-deoxy-L-arabinose transferase-like glycosyltransferase